MLQLIAWNVPDMQNAKVQKWQPNLVIGRILTHNQKLRQCTFVQITNVLEGIIATAIAMVHHRYVAFVITAIQIGMFVSNCT